MKTIKNNRAFSLDALRGYAIMTMILSGTIASGILPGWMYHAQLPPPTNQFNSAVYGITWVDLVFPFFLFAMGASFPLSIGRKFEKGISRCRLAWSSIERGIKLTFFAIFIQHMYPWILSSPQDITAWILSLSSFVLMFFMFVRFPFNFSEWKHRLIELVAFAIGIGMLLSMDYADNRSFSLGFSNIIILVLANMAIFGSLSYLFTIHNKWARIGILPFVMAIFLGSSTEESWVKEVMNFSPLPWMYNFYYLKYLFIVLTGSIAGEFLMEWMNAREKEEQRGEDEKKRTPFILFLCVALIVFNLYGLYMRFLVLNLFGTIILLTVFNFLLKVKSPNFVFWRKLFIAGAYLLMLGLFFEAYEGGIRKDHSTYSYYFVTSGLAFIALIGFSIMCDIYRWRRFTAPLEMAGQNPMIAYVAPNLLIMPLLNLTGLAEYLGLLTQNAWLGFLRGMIVTTLAILVAMLFTKLKLFWKT